MPSANCADESTVTSRAPPPSPTTATWCVGAPDAKQSNSTRRDLNSTIRSQFPQLEPGPTARPLRQANWIGRPSPKISICAGCRFRGKSSAFREVPGRSDQRFSKLEVRVLPSMTGSGSQVPTHVSRRTRADLSASSDSRATILNRKKEGRVYPRLQDFKSTAALGPCVSLCRRDQADLGRCGPSTKDFRLLEGHRRFVRQRIPGPTRSRPRVASAPQPATKR